MTLSLKVFNDVTMIDVLLYPKKKILKVGSKMPYRNSLIFFSMHFFHLSTIAYIVLNNKNRFFFRSCHICCQNQLLRKESCLIFKVEKSTGNKININGINFSEGGAKKVCKWALLSKKSLVTIVNPRHVSCCFRGLKQQPLKHEKVRSKQKNIEVERTVK